MNADRNGLEIPDRAECLRLFVSATIGRIGLHTGALPMVLPVNFCLTDDGVVIRTGRGTKLERSAVGVVLHAATIGPPGCDCQRFRVAEPRAVGPE